MVSDWQVSLCYGAQLTGTSRGISGLTERDIHGVGVAGSVPRRGKFKPEMPSAVGATWTAGPVIGSATRHVLLEWSHVTMCMGL
ncbi:hypothetical protein GDO86_015289 [Hymenochirus boettgeri]|uniref:Uncharacterized protein n=1 Tax=Hymenochirus boettgeri TaxID=247094 RepID=A0A8T2JXA5_9PIPI|nr:hypothetical protein GDO86_015289 [Hymenochirus boettgeri]